MILFIQNPEPVIKTKKTSLLRLFLAIGVVFGIVCVFRPSDGSEKPITFPEYRQDPADSSIAIKSRPPDRCDYLWKDAKESIISHQQSIFQFPGDKEESAKEVAHDVNLMCRDCKEKMEFLFFEGVCDSIALHGWEKVLGLYNFF